MPGMVPARPAGRSGKACREARWHHPDMNASIFTIRACLKRAVAVLAAAILAGCATHTPVPDEAAPATVLLVSIDGFRADYLDRGRTPQLSRLAREGVRAQWMV